MNGLCLPDTTEPVDCRCCLYLIPLPRQGPCQLDMPYKGPPLSSLLVIQRGIERLVALQEPANGPCPAPSSAVSHGVRLMSMSILLSRH